MVLIVLLYVSSIACYNWFLNKEKEGNILMNINKQTVSHNLKALLQRNCIREYLHGSLS